MAFSGGVYTLPTPALVPGQIVSSSENNTVRNDMAASFNLTWLRNGTAAATANIPMGSFKLTGLGAATTNGDALSYGAAAVVTTLTSTSLTATRVPYAGTGGLLQDASTFTFDGTTLTAGGFTTSGAISAGTITASGAITVSGGTANGVAYLNGSKVLTTGSALTFDGTNLTVGGAYQSGSYKLASYVASGNQGISIVNGGNAGSDYAAMSFMQAGTSKATIYTNNDNFTFNANTGAAIYQIAGAEQMRLTSTGLGIGTSSPVLKLDVAFSSAGDGIRTYNTLSTGFADVRIGNNSNNNLGFIRVGGSAQGGIYQDSLVVGTGGGYPIKIAPQASVAATFDTSGNLGLGVTPSAWGGGFKAMQYIGGSVSSQASGYLYTSQNAYYNGTSWTYSANGGAVQYEQSNAQHQWKVAGYGTAGNAITFTQAMTLDASGNFYVGTTSQTGGSNITFNQTANADMKIAASASTATRAAYQVFVNSTVSTVGTENSSGGSLAIGTSAYATVLANNGAYPICLATNNTERMRIDSSGNLLVGQTSNPSSFRAIFNTGAAGNTNALSLSNNANADMNFSLSSGVSLISPTTGILAFGTSSTERMRIDSSGNVGIGTSSPSTLLSLSAASTPRLSIIDTTNAVQFQAIADDNNVYTGSVTNHPYVFITNSLERMRIDSSGNVGIGTSSPSYDLQVGTYGTDADSTLALASSTTGTGSIRFGDGTSGTDANAGLLRYDHSNNSMVFWTSTTERMRIDSSGNLLVGKTSAATSGEGWWLQSTTADGGRQNITRGNNTNTQTHLSFYTNAGTQVGTVNTTTTSTAYNTSSDYRLKENIQPMQNALATVAQLNPVTYTWKADGSDGQGFIAHELQAVVPDCVTGEKDAVDEEGKPVYQGIDTSFLVATLTKAIQELEARVKQLEGK